RPRLDYLRREHRAVIRIQEAFGFFEGRLPIRVQVDVVIGHRGKGVGVAPFPLECARDAGPVVPGQPRGEARRHPAIRALCDTLKRALEARTRERWARVRSDPDGTGLLHGARLERDVLEGAEAAFVGDALLGPQAPADLDVLDETVRALAVGHLERHTLARAGTAGHEPGARGQEHAAVRDEVERRPLV